MWYIFFNIKTTNCGPKLWIKLNLTISIIFILFTHKKWLIRKPKQTKIKSNYIGLLFCETNLFNLHIRYPNKAHSYFYWSNLICCSIYKLYDQFSLSSLFIEFKQYFKTNVIRHVSLKTSSSLKEVQAWRLTRKQVEVRESAQNETLPCLI